MFQNEHNATYVIWNCAAKTLKFGVLVSHESRHSLTSLKKTICRHRILCYVCCGAGGLTQVHAAVCCGAGGLTQVHAADPIGITYAAPVATAVFTNGWQHSDLVRTSRHHAAEPSVVVANVVSARCMARQSTGALVGGATCAESRRAVSRTNLQALCCAGRSCDLMSSLPMQSIIWRLTSFKY